MVDFIITFSILLWGLWRRYSSSSLFVRPLSLLVATPVLKWALLDIWERQIPGLALQRKLPPPKICSFTQFGMMWVYHAYQFDYGNLRKICGLSSGWSWCFAACSKQYVVTALFRSCVIDTADDRRRRGGEQCAARPLRRTPSLM